MVDRWQPPSGGCVLKLYAVVAQSEGFRQPPSGGCVLKLLKAKVRLIRQLAAAFGRLCVETVWLSTCNLASCAAAFGRLCVETLPHFVIALNNVAAAFGRLCVETPKRKPPYLAASGSRLRAAVC